MISISLPDLFAEQWGFNPQPFDPQFEHVKGVGGPLSDRKEYGKQGSPYWGKGKDGREYYMPISITYAENLGSAPDGSELEINKTIDLPYTCVSVNRRKRLIDTELTEREGTATELINLGNYEFRLYGFVIGPTKEFPEDDVLKLQELDDIAATVTVRSVLTDIYLGKASRKGSYECIIRDFTAPMQRGNANVRPFELLLTSVMPFNLIEIV